MNDCPEHLLPKQDTLRRNGYEFASNNSIGIGTQVWVISRKEGTDPKTARRGIVSAHSDISVTVKFDIYKQKRQPSTYLFSEYYVRPIREVTYERKRTPKILKSEKDHMKVFRFGVMKVVGESNQEWTELNPFGDRTLSARRISKMFFNRTNPNSDKGPMLQEKLEGLRVARNGPQGYQTGYVREWTPDTSNKQDRFGGTWTVKWHGSDEEQDIDREGLFEAYDLFEENSNAKPSAKKPAAAKRTMLEGDGGKKPAAKKGKKKAEMEEKENLSDEDRSTAWDNKNNGVNV